MRANLDHLYMRCAFAALAAAFLAVPAARAAVSWSQDLRGQEMLALAQKKPVIVFFIGNGKFDATLFNREPVDRLGDKAFYAFVGADLQDKTTPDQIALEKQFNVTQFPTILLLRAVMTKKDSESGGFYDFRESARCPVTTPGACAALIMAAIRNGQ